MRYKLVRSKRKEKLKLEVYDGGFLEPNESAVEEIQDMKWGENFAVMQINGRLFTVGDNKEGQLGLGTYQLTDEMNLIARSRAVSAYDCGDMHAAYVPRKNDRVYTWGHSIGGKLGLGN